MYTKGILARITNRAKVLTAFRNGGADRIRYGLPYNGGGMGLVLERRSDDYLQDIAAKARQIPNTLVIYHDYQDNDSNFLAELRRKTINRLQTNTIGGIKLSDMHTDAIRASLVLKGIMPVIIISNVDYPILRLDDNKVERTPNYLLYNGSHYMPLCWLNLHAFEECNWSSLIFSLHKPNYPYVYNYFNNTKVRPINPPAL